MRLQKYLLAFLLLVVTITPRLSGLKSFVTVDEPFWLSVGANYYYALARREFQNTVYEYHPAVTTMSVITAAFLVDFPDYRSLGQGYFDVDKEKFDPFIVEHGHAPLHLLYLSRIVQVMVIVLLALLIFYFLSILIGEKKAFLVTVLISSAPYFLGHSRVLSHEAMVSFFVLTSIFGMMAYLEAGRKWYHLLLSAAAAALAQLTKSSAMAMFPVVVLVLAVSIFEKRKDRGFNSALLDHLKIFGIWFSLMILVYFIVWPGMWVAPGKMLYEVYGNAFSYAFQGSRLQVSQELQPSRFTIDTVGVTAKLYVTSILESGTIITWLGVVFAVASLLLRGQSKPSQIEKRMMAYLFTTALMFVLLFSVAQGLNYRHYVMTAHVSMSAIGALGWAVWLGWLGTKWKTTYISTSGIHFIAVVLLIALQFMEGVPFYPYFYTYYNPVVAALTGKPPASNYGEGIEKAAAYLAQKPGGQSLRVFSYRGRGPFSYFFPGETIILNPMFMDEPGMHAMFERLERADYVVITDTLAFRSPGDGLFVRSLNLIPPEHSIYIRGVSPIRIYRVADLPPAFYEALSK